MSPKASRSDRVLVVEDDEAIRELVRDHLALAGFEIDEAGDGRDALQRARAGRYTLIILDLMLPHVDGFTLCRTLRGQGVNRDTPILMLTARHTESDTVLGLESGADDYLTKPFGLRELMARIGAILRRSRTTHETEAEHPLPPVAVRGLSIDPRRREVRMRDESIELTRHEFDLLYLLASRAGIVFSREALIARVWKGDAFVTERTVDTVVSRLRKKVEHDPQDPKRILTEWGVGYRFADLE